MSKEKDCQEFDSTSPPGQPQEADSGIQHEDKLVAQSSEHERGTGAERVTAVDGKGKRIKAKKFSLFSWRSRTSQPTLSPDSGQPHPESPKVDFTEVEARVRGEYKEQVKQWEEEREAEWRAKVQELERELKGVRCELDKKGKEKSPLVCFSSIIRNIYFFPLLIR